MERWLGFKYSKGQRAFQSIPRSLILKQGPRLGWDGGQEEGGKATGTPPSWESLYLVRVQFVAVRCTHTGYEVHKNGWALGSHWGPLASFTDEESDPSFHRMDFSYHTRQLFRPHFVPLRPLHCRVLFGIQGPFLKFFSNWELFIGFHVRPTLLWKMQKVNVSKKNRRTCQSDMEVADNTNKYWTVLEWFSTL